MTPNLWRVSLIVVLSVALAAPARAESWGAVEAQFITGIVVVSAGIAVLVTVVIVHHKHKRSAITGCVTTGANGMSLTDEKDKRIYALTGDPPGMKPGDRMTLEGKRKQSGSALVFQAQAVTKDFGVCQP
jgi:hypothetical protein